ncbi:hypothetical protein TURU_037521 [Turdus rufiventris]|nr:hypothetical protein TURU_037521 [Turdus rufiventris]
MLGPLLNLQLDPMPLIVAFWSLLFSLFSIHLNPPHPPLQFAYEDVVKDSVENVAGIEVDNIHCSPSIQVAVSSYKAIRLVKHDFMISESMMITPDDLIIHVDRDGLQKEVSLSRDCSEAGWQSSGTSPDLHDHTVGFLGSECALPGHVELFVQHHSQVPVLVLGIALTQLQDLALGFVELQEVHMGSALEPVPLNDLPHIRNISQTIVHQTGFYKADLVYYHTAVTSVSNSHSGAHQFYQKQCQVPGTGMASAQTVPNSCSSEYHDHLSILWYRAGMAVLSWAKALPISVADYAWSQLKLVKLKEYREAENFNASIIKEKNSVVSSHAQILNKMGLSQYIGPKFQIVARFVLCYLSSQNRVTEGLQYAEIIPN